VAFNRVRYHKAVKAFGILLLLAVVAARAASADVDHERARRAYEAREIVSLGDILTAVERDHKGQVVEVELEREGGRWVYEVELLTPSGRMLELLYDAATAKPIGVEP
jgi:uncharacterized membrane protein YkoI